MGVSDERGTPVDGAGNTVREVIPLWQSGTCRNQTVERGKARGEHPSTASGRIRSYPGLPLSSEGLISDPQQVVGSQIGPGRSVCAHPLLMAYAPTRHSLFVSYIGAYRGTSLKTLLPRNLQLAQAQNPMLVPGGWVYLKSEVPLYHLREVNYDPCATGGKHFLAGYIGIPHA